MTLALYLLGIFAWVAATILFWAAMRELPARTWRGRHHYYWGSVALALGVGAWAVGWGWLGALLAVGGGAVAFDDGLQHHRQAASGDLTYRSPLHRWFYRVFPSLARY